MKKLTQLTLLLLLLALLLPATANAYDFKVDGFYYYVFDGKAIVTSGDYSYSGNKVIPETVNYNGTNYTVTEIDECAFLNCTGLTSISIPNTVTYIDEGAFSGCSSLTSCLIGSSVTHIGGNAFTGCSALTSINIPSSVTYIGQDAFSGCSRLTSVNINDLDAWCNINFFNSYSNPCYFAHHLFLNGNEIINLMIPNSVTTIRKYSFSGCSGLTSVYIPNSVTSIGRGAFVSCSKLTSLNIPNSVSSIDGQAFSSCSSLTNITIPNSVTTIGYEAFSNTAWYINQPDGIVYAGLVAYKYKGSMPGGISVSISLREGTKGIASSAFYGCSGLTQIDIPNTVSNIGASAFKNCTGLTSVIIPNSVISIGDETFYNCTSLTSITIGESVSSIGDDAFDECDSVIELNWNARNCSTKGSLHTSNIENVTIGSEVELLPLGFVASSKITEVSIPNSVNFIQERAFYNCNNLKDVYTYIENPSLVQMGEPYSTNGYSIFASYSGGYRRLHVPAGTLSSYQAIPTWSDYFNGIVEMIDIVLATSIELDVNNTEITEGETLQLTATVLPEEATDKTVTWASSDDAVATVDQNGLVTAVAPGTATITATTIDGSNLTASCMVTVEPNVILATSIELNQTSAEVTEGGSLQLTATVLPEDATEKDVAWSSSDEAVATVDQNGLVTAVAAGAAAITATTVDGSELSATCEVTVNSPATASNSLDADALSAYCGEEKQLAVRMDNESSITALQCDIYLPEGISIATEDGDYLIDLVPARKASNHTVSTNDLPNGAIRLFITSATSKPFKGNSGDLFILNLIVDEDAESGEYSIDLRNIILSDTEAHPYYVPDLNVPVTIMDYIKGDVNIDGTVNVSDYVATANYILELDPHPFLFVAADIDENLAINVSDLVGVANIALNFMGAPAVNHAPAMGYDGDGLMSFTADCSTISSNKHIVTLDLSNSSAVTAFQMDINLPEGLKLVNASLSGRGTASHSLEMTTLASGAYRLLGASMMSKAFVGSEGILLTLEIEGATSGMAIIDGIMLAEPDATLHKHDAMTLAFDNSGVQEMMSDVSIYLQDGMVVVESPVASKVQFILPNGMSVVHEVKPGRNIYNTGLEGVVIVKVGSQVKKFKL